MGLFSRKPRQDSDAIARLEALERRLKVIEADWDEWYDKFRRLYARLSKRVERGDGEESRSPQEPRTAGGRPMNALAAAILHGRGSDGVLPDG